MPISPAPPRGRNSSSSAVGLWKSPAVVVADVVLGGFNVLNRHGPRRRTIHEFLSSDGCKLVDGTPARTMTRKRGILSSIPVPPVDFHETTHGDLRIQMMDEWRDADEKRGQAAGGDNLQIGA